jgi:hypothetical protein
MLRMVERSTSHIRREPIEVAHIAGGFHGGLRRLILL